ncbi:MAG: hypothetical protein ACI9A1_002013 [Lentimonas sp.]
MACEFTRDPQSLSPAAQCKDPHKKRLPMEPLLKFKLSRKPYSPDFCMELSMDEMSSPMPF